jgi:hypothetical protein
MQHHKGCNRKYVYFSLEVHFPLCSIIWKLGIYFFG